MLGSVQAQHQQGVLWRQARYLAFADDSLPGSRHQILHAQINRIEVRQQRPLQFDQVLSISAVKRALVACPKPQAFGCGTLDGRVDLSGRPISDFSQSLLRALEVHGRNQEVEVRKTSQAAILEKQLRK